MSLPWFVLVTVTCFVGRTIPMTPSKWLISDRMIGRAKTSRCQLNQPEHSCFKIFRHLLLRMVEPHECGFQVFLYFWDCQNWAAGISESSSIGGWTRFRNRSAGDPSWHCGKPLQELSAHAVYMRLRRLCEKKAYGKLAVNEETHKQWLEGNRDVLSLALVKALKKHGTDNQKKVCDLVRKEFQAQVIKVCCTIPCLLVRGFMFSGQEAATAKPCSTSTHQTMTILSWYTVFE